MPFPSNPDIGSIYTTEKYRFSWDGERWTTLTESLTSGKTRVDDIINDGDYTSSQIPGPLTFPLVVNSPGDATEVLLKDSGAGLSFNPNDNLLRVNNLDIGIQAQATGLEITQNFATVQEKLICRDEVSGNVARDGDGIPFSGIISEARRFRVTDIAPETEVSLLGYNLVSFSRVDFSISTYNTINGNRSYDEFKVLIGGPTQAFVLDTISPVDVNGNIVFRDFSPGNDTANVLSSSDHKITVEQTDADISFGVKNLSTTDVADINFIITLKIYDLPVDI